MEKVKATVTSPANTERHLEIEIPRERFNDIFDENVKKYSKELRLDGYRKGAIPRRIVAERFREPITNESLEKLVEKVIREVCEENSIKPVAPGKVEDLKNQNDEPIQIKAVIEVDQEVEFTNYTDLGIKVLSSEKVTDKDVNGQIEAYCENLAKEEKVDGPGEKGLIAKGEYLQIIIDGKELKLENSKKFSINIGGDKIPEFNEAFNGSRAGEEKEIAVRHPDNYPVPELAGKTGRYNVKILEICRSIVPQVDEELAKKLGAKDLADLRENTRKNMEHTRSLINKRKAEKEVIEKIIQAHPFDVPKARVDLFMEYMCQQNNIKVEDLPEAERSAQEKEAIFNIKRHRILDQISRSEKIKATQQEVDAKIAEMAGQYGMQFDDLKASLRQSGKTNDIREEIKHQKILDFLLGESKE
jgi:trigger factor